MKECTLLCRQCRNVFKAPVAAGLIVKLEMKCPKCGSLDIGEAPAWAPLGSGLNIFESSEWEYECQQCRNKFKMPVPKSPSEQKERRCAICGSGHLHLLTIAGAEPLYCG
jgi:rRNA maturation endonuclease Nob1